MPHLLSIGAARTRVKDYPPTVFTRSWRLWVIESTATMVEMDLTSEHIAILVAISLPLLALDILAWWDLVMRRPDLSIPRKVLWGSAMLVLGYVGLFAYIVSRPPPIPDGKGVAPKRDASTRKVDELEALVDAHRAGSMPDVEFESRKRAILLD